MRRPIFPILFLSFILLITHLTYAQSLGIFDDHADIGNVGAAGDVIYYPEEKKYEITGSGSGIWSQNDEFHYVYLHAKGNFRLSATIEPDSIDAKRVWATSGLMIRNTLEEDDLYFGFGLRAYDVAGEVQYRATKGGAAGFSNLVKASQHENRLEIERTGNYLSAFYYAAETGERVLFEQQKVEMADSLLAGLYVTSFDDGKLAFGIFREVQITPLSTSGERNLPQITYQPNEPILVSIHLFEAGENVTVQEQIPVDWQVADISHDGAFENGGITWSFPEVAGDEVLTYTVIPTADSPDEVFFDGTVGDLPIAGRDKLSLLKQIGDFENYANIGDVSPPGSIEYDADSGEYVMLAGGKDLLATDVFFVYSEIHGDFTLQAQVVAENLDAHRMGMAGIGLVDELIPAPIAYVAVVRSDSMQRKAGMAYRATPGSFFQGKLDALSADVQDGRLQLVRQGNEMTMNYFNIETQQWTFFDKRILDFTDPVYVGLIGGSGQAGSYYEVHYTDVIFHVEQTRVMNWLLY